MKNRSLAETWLLRARSNLSRAREGKSNPDIVYEDLCFDCEQAAEKSLKGLLILGRYRSAPDTFPLPPH